MAKQKYQVYVDDNFHFMDTNERYGSGSFDTYEQAVARCKEIVDDFLQSALEPDMTAKQLLASYQMFGEDPFIVGDNVGSFTAWDYAETQCAKLAIGNKQ